MERRGVSASRACSLPVVSKTRMGNCGAVLGGMGDAGSAGAGNVVDGTTVAVAPLVSVGSWWVGLWVDKWGEWVGGHSSFMSGVEGSSFMSGVEGSTSTRSYLR